MTTTTPGLFACKKISFNESFYNGPEITILASVGHSMKSTIPRSGGAVWVEDVKFSGFTACVVEYGEGSNGTTEVNWIALKSGFLGPHVESASLNTWTTGTKCKKIDFQKVC